MVRAGISEIIVLILTLCLCTALASAGPVNAAPSPQSQGAQPSQYEIRLFIPASGSVHSDQVNDLINGKSGDVLLATSFGLSDYNGSWSTRHVTRGNVSLGLMDDFITAIEYDYPAGNLWIGYSGGIQIYNGIDYRTIRDQQLLKSTRIIALQCWNDTMWVATGDAGIHRFRNGVWTYFKPFSKGGPGFTEVDSMALDPVSDALFIATVDNGTWIVPSYGDPVTFRRIDSSRQVPPPLRHVRQNPLGGAFFFDDRTVSRYTTTGGWATVLSVPDLTQRQIDINDIAAAPDGTLYIGTDDGIFIWRDGSVTGHIGGTEGIGPSTVVRRLFYDAKNRLWFATQGFVGYYRPKETMGPEITIQVMNITTTAQVTTEITTLPSPTTTESTPVPTMTATVKEPSLLQRLTEFFSGILSKFSR